VVSPPNIQSGALTSDVTLGFTGQEGDDDLSLVNMNGRIYDTGTARFLTPDPFANAATGSQSLNRYSYVQNSPMNLIDPSGLTWYKPWTWGPNGGLAGWLGGRTGVSSDGTFTAPIGLGPGQNVSAGPTNIWGDTGPKPMIEGNVDDQAGSSSMSASGDSTPEVEQGIAGVYQPNGTYLDEVDLALISAGYSGVSDADVADLVSDMGTKYACNGTCGGMSGEGGDPIGTTDVTLVSRSIGGNGTMSSEQHLGLIVDSGAGVSPSEYLVQGGPVNGHLEGRAIPVDDGLATFGHAEGADWGNPSRTVELNVRVVGTYAVAGGVSADELSGIADGLNARFSAAPYNYANGPNSNTYVRDYMGALGLNTDITLPVKVKGW
jgi:RHS repeat-associated protein